MHACVRVCVCVCVSVSASACVHMCYKCVYLEGGLYVLILHGSNKRLTPYAHQLVYLR